eukprot:2635613-Pleurochrysis_carterae.AAC.1
MAYRGHQGQSETGLESSLNRKKKRGKKVLLLARAIAKRAPGSSLSFAQNATGKVRQLWLTTL